MTEDQKADEIIGTIRGMMHQFKLTPYNEDTGRGFLRHVLVKRGFSSNQIMVVLVTGTPVFPSKNHFVAALREKASGNHNDIDECKSVSDQYGARRKRKGFVW